MKDISRNLTMLFDYYELTMGQGYFKRGLKDRIAYFDVFYRKNPENGGYAIAAGLEQIVDYINNLRNRIAHHEPICFNNKVEKDTAYVRNRHKRMMTLFEWMGLDGEALLYGLDHCGKVWKQIDNL